MVPDNVALCGRCGMRTHFEGGPNASRRRPPKVSATLTGAALPWRGNGLPVSALIIAEEDMVIGVNSEPLVATRGHREDGEMAGQRSWSGKNSLKRDRLPARSPVRRRSPTQLQKRARHRWLRRLGCDASKDAAHDAACSATHARWFSCGPHDRRELLLSGRPGYPGSHVGEWPRSARSFGLSGCGRRRGWCWFTRIGHLGQYGFIADGPFARCAQREPPG